MNKHIDLYGLLNCYAQNTQMFISITVAVDHLKIFFENQKKQTKQTSIKSLERRWKTFDKLAKRYNYDVFCARQFQAIYSLLLSRVNRHVCLDQTEV